MGRRGFEFGSFRIVLSGGSVSWKGGSRGK